MSVRGSDIIAVLLALLFPPVAVALIAGCSCDLLINFLLTLLGWIPGTLHAFWLIYKKMRAEEQYGEGGFRYVGNGTYEPVYHTQQPVQAPNYGSTA
ncbi:UPF0057-domain-containing protein [Pterulicium gracile]|uniref:UPF0057-domain-containing protein n=1 Tax=Pterulicium gracile TaxID=1884261 RepID=A0A5C3QQU1_9AGAR|nr:UPF0057-domain-containing protein [Pterula gracilis]